MFLCAMNSFSTTNAPAFLGANLAYFQLNAQTPSPPRGAVPVNQSHPLHFSAHGFSVQSCEWHRLLTLYPTHLRQMSVITAAFLWQQNIAPREIFPIP